jgi:hypothetical protein
MLQGLGTRHASRDGPKVKKRSKYQVLRHVDDQERERRVFTIYIMIEHKTERMEEVHALPRR